MKSTWRMGTKYESGLGQLVFTTQINEYEKYECPDYVTSLVQCLLGEIRRVQPEWNEDEDLDFAGIEYHPYYWGDCTCGYDEEKRKWYENHHHTADCFHMRYLAEEKRLLWDKLEGQSILGKWRKVRPYLVQWSKSNGYEDASHGGMAIYCTCPYGQEWSEWSSTHFHAPDCKLMLPNFKFGEAGICWYKHVGRDMCTNVDWDETKWREWFNNCLAAIRKDSNISHGYRRHDAIQ